MTSRGVGRAALVVWPRRRRTGGQRRCGHTPTLAVSPSVLRVLRVVMWMVVVVDGGVRVRIGVGVATCVGVAVGVSVPPHCKVVPLEVRVPAQPALDQTGERVQPACRSPHACTRHATHRTPKRTLRGALPTHTPFHYLALGSSLVHCLDGNVA